MQDLRALSRQLLSGSTMVMLFAASAALLAIFSYAPKPAPTMSPVSVIAAVGLTDDDGGQGLFRTTGLLPGRAVSRCMKVSYAGPTGGTVYFSAADITGPLAAILRIRVEQGTGGDGSGCAGFEPASTVFDGMLPELVDADPAAPRTSTGWSPAATDARTYRITATMEDSSLPDKTSTATFRWFVFGLPTPEPSEPGVGVAEEPVPSPPVAQSAEAAPAVDQSVDPAGAVPAPSNTGGSSTQSDRAAAEKKPIEKLREALAKIGQDITEVAVRTSTHSALPVAGFAVLLAFLTLQNRIDRLDPKLALAPMKDPHLVFRDPSRDVSDDDLTPAVPFLEDA